MKKDKGLLLTVPLDPRDNQFKIKTAMTESTVKFNILEKQYEFKIYHNLPDVEAGNIEGAIGNWLSRTDDFTPESLRAYIMSKERFFDGLMCYTQEQFEQIINSAKPPSS